jgi:hypothetical protein
MINFLNLSLWIFAPTLWTCLVTYAAWFLARAKRYSSISPTVAKQLWTIHRHNDGCGGKKWQMLTKGKNTIGFRCECGYEHVQKKPLLGYSSVILNRQEVTTLDSLHAAHESR